MTERKYTDRRNLSALGKKVLDRAIDERGYPKGCFAKAACSFPGSHFDRLNATPAD